MPKRVCVLYYLGLTVNTKYVKRNWDINYLFMVDNKTGLDLFLFILNTVKPVLSGHPRDPTKCPLNRGCPPNEGL